MGKLGCKVNFPLLLTHVSCIAAESQRWFEIHPVGCKSENTTSKSNFSACILRCQTVFDVLSTTSGFPNQQLLIRDYK